MTETISLDKDQQCKLLAVEYLNACDQIFSGLKRQHKENTFHFLITLRSFIEYTRRGIWFLCWANPEKIKEARNPTFAKPGSPDLVTMDEMINEKLGKGKVSSLMLESPGIKEPFVDILHALTHGNPLAVRLIALGLDKTFNAEMLLARAEYDLNLFRILLWRRMLGETQKDTWKILSGIHNHPAQVEACVKEAAFLLKRSGKADRTFNTKKKSKN
jgi:hypothetical protein